MEPTGTEAPKGSESINDKLRAVITPLQTVINETQILKDERLDLDERDHDIRSPSFGFGAFSFWGGIEPEGIHVELPSEITAVIKNLRIPKELRKKGLGSKIVKTWEEELSKQGIRVFTATNIKDQRAIDFWRKQGYQIPQGESHKVVPYCMYKMLEHPPAA